jgi:hypothetical protein
MALKNALAIWKHSWYINKTLDTIKIKDVLVLN